MEKAGWVSEEEKVWGMRSTSFCNVFGEPLSKKAKTSSLPSFQPSDGFVSNPPAQAPSKVLDGLSLTEADLDELWNVYDVASPRTGLLRNERC